ncbi:hypothetical protein K491DRAFT_720456 [Lophiostoma macrostomum CBS 122681]|uniref:Low temperature requirement A n=1 Tax=Lophiostoma macrostomum CBS 122681 TaxID=1314788 RepID=A0A6A6SWH5_9PLEO|nr:hypothetical protein K491DRAFT_720456 [Lophiostoma macrostomum CBS 122681]
MHISRYLNDWRKTRSTPPSRSSHQRTYLPFLASPINRDVLDTVSGVTSNRHDVYPYRIQHEASTVELFYDLFFVANLAYFTAMHQHTDGSSLANYIKLFTMTWFTWLGVTLFDTRFAVDSLWNRFSKAIQFGVMTVWVYAGGVYDKSDDIKNDARSYKNFATALAFGRFAIAVQYFVVMYQSRMFRRTLIPVGLSGLVHVLAGAAFMVQLFVLPKGSVDNPEQITLFIIAIAEGLAIFIIAIFWRIVSFKYTHLVERLQLLTLIIIGEGIIGMVKSTACITKAQSSTNAAEVGTVISSVLLLYLIYMLYFDSLSHDRFGTIRQQIWSLFHYPLHMAIVLCVEGNTSLIVWNSAVQALNFIRSVSPTDPSDPAAGFKSSADYIASLTRTMQDINDRFISVKWNSTYDWTRNLTAIANLTKSEGFKSDSWNNKTGELVTQIFENAQIFAFSAHKDTLGAIKAVKDQAGTPRMTLDAVFKVFNVTVLQFYIGAGAMLLLLAVIYWFNKKNKSKLEIGDMVTRVVVGVIGIVFGLIVVLANKGEKGFKFIASSWIVAIAVFGFLFVLLVDNIILAIAHHSSGHVSYRSHKQRGPYNDDDDTVKLVQTSSIRDLGISKPLPTQQDRQEHATHFVTYEHDGSTDGVESYALRERGKSVV